MEKATASITARLSFCANPLFLPPLAQGQGLLRLAGSFAFAETLAVASLP
jgi:hypothetical protein